MKRVLIIIMAALVILTAGATPAQAKAVKGHKVIACPMCEDGHDLNCFYSYTKPNGKRKHMSEKQIEEYLFIESHYQDANGNWIER